MTSRERLRARVDELLATHAIPLAVTVWLDQWLTHESEEDLEGWELRVVGDAVSARRGTHDDGRHTIDEVEIGADVLAFERRRFGAGFYWLGWVEIDADGTVRAFADPLDDAQRPRIQVAGDGWIGK